MENQNIKKNRGRPKKQVEDANLKTLQDRQHNYYLNYKNKKNVQVLNTPDVIPEEEPKHEKTMCELINDIIEKCNQMKSRI
jgi:hypothetical protein